MFYILTGENCIPYRYCYHGQNSWCNNKFCCKYFITAVFWCEDACGGTGRHCRENDTYLQATGSIDTISDAISKVSKQRSELGAVQNRLESLCLHRLISQIRVYFLFYSNFIMYLRKACKHRELHPGFPIFSILNYALYKNFSASIISNSEK